MRPQNADWLELFLLSDTMRGWLEKHCGLPALAAAAAAAAAGAAGGVKLEEEAVKVE